MIQIALIPILGVLLLLAMTVYVQSRRSAKVAALKQSVEKKVRTIVRDDAANDQTLVENIIGGVGIDQALQQFQKTRAGLLPGGRAETPSLWTAEHLGSWKAKTIKRGIESVNRGLMVPVFFSFLAIVAVCVVATVVLYNFQSAGGDAYAAPSATPPLAPVPFDPAPLSPVVQPPPVPLGSDSTTEPLLRPDGPVDSPDAVGSDVPDVAPEPVDPLSLSEEGLKA